MSIDSNNKTYRSGAMIVEPQRGLVSANEESIRLGPVNMAVLICLIEGRGEVISRTEIFDRVWTNQVVNDDTLTRCISDLRTSLTKLSDLPTLIETLPKRGYRWVPEVDSNHKKDSAQSDSSKSALNWAVSAIIFVCFSLLLFYWLINIKSGPIIPGLLCYLLKVMRRFLRR